MFELNERKYEYMLISKYSMEGITFTNLVDKKGEILNKIGAYYLPIEKRFHDSYPKDGVVIEQYIDGRVVITGPEVEICKKDFKDFRKKFSELFDIQFDEPKLEKVKATQLMQKSIEFAVPKALLKVVEKETDKQYLLDKTHYIFKEVKKMLGKEIEISLSEEKEAGQPVFLKVTVVAPDKETVDRIMDELGGI